MTKKEEIEKLRRKRDELWEKFCRLPKKGSFSGLHVSEQLESVQQKLDKLESAKRSKRYYPNITIETG